MAQKFFFFLNQVLTFNSTILSQNETHGIYTKLLYRHLIGDIENESSNSKTNASILNRLKNLQDVLKNVIQSSIELNNKMRSIYLEKSQRLHYVFTLGVLTSLFRYFYNFSHFFKSTIILKKDSI